MVERLRSFVLALVVLTTASMELTPPAGAVPSSLAHKQIKRQTPDTEQSKNIAP